MALCRSLFCARVELQKKKHQSECTVLTPFADIPDPNIFFVCRCVGPSFANPHGIVLAFRLPLHFEPFADDLIKPYFLSFLWRNLMRIVCRKIFEPFAARYLNRLPQDIWTVCHKIFEPFAYIPAPKMPHGQSSQACLWPFPTRIMETASKTTQNVGQNK